MSQIGGPTVDAVSGTSVNAVWATKQSNFSYPGSPGSNYSRGDIVSFDDGGSTNFSQMVTIVVDSTQNGGQIDDFHFLYGGLYAAPGPSGALTQSNFSNTTGTGAKLNPVWSGWSLMNNTPYTAGSHYAVGDILGVTTPGTTSSGTPPRIIVEQVQTVMTTPGVVSAFDFISYGYFPTVGTSPATLATTNLAGSMTGMGFQIGTSTAGSYAYWDRGPFATKLDSPITVVDTTPTGTTGSTTITFKSGSIAPSYPQQMQIQSIYFTDNVTAHPVVMRVWGRVWVR